MTTANHQVAVRLYGKSKTIHSDGHMSSTDSYGNNLLYVGKRWVGDNDPAFALKISRLQSATNKYDMYQNKFIYTRDARMAVNGGPAGAKYSYLSTFGQGGLSASFSSDIISKLTNACMMSIYKKVAKEQQSIQGLPFLGEFRNTVHMIKHPAEALARYANQRAHRLIQAKLESAARSNRIRRRKASKKSIIRALNREARDLRKTIAASYLELKFGAQPLIADLRSAAELAYASFPTNGSIKLFNSTFVDRVTTSRDVATVFGGTHTYVETIQEEYEYKVHIKARYAYRGQYDGMSYLELLKAKSGFTMNDVVPALWELAPLSVFVDQFVNVSSILTACCTETHDVVSVDRYVTRRLIRRNRIAFRKSSYGAFLYPPTREGLVVSLHKHYSREKWAMNIPSIAFTTPIGELKSLTLAAFLDLAFLT